MNQHLLTLTDLSRNEIESLIARALVFKKKKKGSSKLKRAVIGLLFEKESTRTRISFEVAIHKLGGASIYIGPSTSQLSRGESYADTARVLSRYLDAIVLRAHDHADLEEMASQATIPVINGLTDLHHPCQVLSDLMTICEKKGGDWKKLIIAYVGDGNNMANSWLEAALRLPFNLRLACPKGFMPDGALLKKIKGHLRISLTHDPAEAVYGCDVINTDTWFSMGQRETSEKRKEFGGFQVNGALLKKASPNVIVLHCLPAHRGEEITSEVMDGPHSVIFDQAENRLYVQMALLEMIIPAPKGR